ncbi:hypothetical protein [Bacillus sp. NPDC094106]|uniref:hypothetical protein n=1 Tax=Bacillus sp. NPDC094106 TaxID=3363949 RepID=UPI00382D9D4B
MNSTKLKYLFQKHKDKCLVALSIAVTIGIGTGAYFIFFHDNDDKGKKETLFDKNIKLADAIITGNKNGKVSLLHTKSGDELDSISLGDSKGNEFKFSRSKNLDSVYAYNKNSHTFYEITVDGKKLKKKEIVSVSDALVEFDTFQSDGKNVVLLSSDRKELTHIKDKSTYKKYVSLEEVGEFLVDKGQLVFSTSNFIHSADLKSEKETKIEIGDNTTGLFAVKNEIIAYNKFGTGKEDSIVLRLKPNDLYVKEMHKLGSNRVEPLVPDGDDETLIYSQKVNEKTHPKQLIQVLNSKDGFRKDVRPFKTPDNRKVVDYDKNNSVASKGYVYSKKGSRLEITDIRGENLAYTLDVSKEFAMPIIK